MKNKTLIREIQALVSIAAKTIRNAIDDRLEAGDTGITSLQYGILRIIQHGPETITVISKKQMLDPSTLVPAVDTLERNGFARRTKDPKDRRRTPIEITEKGLALLARFPMLYEDDALVKAVNEMSEAHQQQLLSLMRELVRNLTSEDEIDLLTTTIQAEAQEE
ncbi:MAG: MarR family transcriptional regulator [Chloroflexota bacterium]